MGSAGTVTSDSAPPEPRQIHVSGGTRPAGGIWWGPPGLTTLVVTVHPSRAATLSSLKHSPRLTPAPGLPTPPPHADAGSARASHPQAKAQPDKHRWMPRDFSEARASRASAADPGPGCAGRLPHRRSRDSLVVVGGRSRERETRAGAPAHEDCRLGEADETGDPRRDTAGHAAGTIPPGPPQSQRLSPRACPPSPCHCRRGARSPYSSVCFT